MTKKNVELISPPPTPHWVGDGFRVHNFIPKGAQLSMQRMNPFILLDYNSKYEVKPSNKPKGVGVHPHRGFETVTIAYKGKVEHHDSTGSGGIIGEGDVQWMTAASGVLHKEYHEREWSKKGGIFQMVQLWVNLPAKYKMTSPRYQAIQNSQMGKFILDESGSYVDVIAGSYKNVKGPALTFSPVHLMNFNLKPGGTADISFPENYNTALLVLEGSISINDNHELKTDHLALMAKDGEDFTIKSTSNEDSIVLLMSAEPIDEPIAHYGPFVMNTREELLSTFNDFNNGKFGELED